MNPPVVGQFSYLHVAETALRFSAEEIAGSVNGLSLGSGSSGSTAKGLRIILFNGHGIRVDSSNNRIQGCRIGVAGGGNSSNGVLINNTDNNVIGTDGDGSTDLAERNNISENGASGIEIFGASATGNVIKGNIIGLDTNGNALDGIEIEMAINNTIGGTTPNERNFISATGRSMSGGTTCSIFRMRAICITAIIFRCS